MESGSNSEIQHEYGGDVGENPALVVPEQSGKAVVIQAGLASASAVPGQVEVEDDGGVD